ncbi:hypothetical protein BDV18DRAFT_133757 [Aspergillus unguis]
MRKIQRGVGSRRKTEEKGRCSSVRTGLQQQTSTCCIVELTREISHSKKTGKELGQRTDIANEQIKKDILWDKQ